MAAPNILNIKPFSPNHRDDALYDFVVDLFADLAKQVDFAELMVAREHVPYASHSHAMTVQDSSGAVIFGLEIRPIKSQRTKKEHYQVNDVEIYITNSKGNFPDQPYDTISREDTNMFIPIKEEIRERFREILVTLQRERPLAIVPLKTSEIALN